MSSSLKRTLTSSLTIQYAIAPVLVALYKLTLDQAGPAGHGFTWYDVLVPFLGFLIFIPFPNYRLFSGRIALGRWSWYPFCAGLIIAISFTHSVVRTEGPISFPALLILGGLLPFIGVMGPVRLTILGLVFIPSYLLTLIWNDPGNLSDRWLDHLWICLMMILGVAAVLTRSSIDASRTLRIAALRRRAGRAAREVVAEKKRADGLLLNILPENIADELKNHDRVQPVRYDSASVLFTDFKGFTQQAERMQPEELVQELDLCFRSFDSIASHHGLEKLKTIGDSFMCAGGIPMENSTHAVDCCLAALAMRHFMNDLRRKRQSSGQDFWEIRIGIHTGPLVAGVIGESKFSYDVWGDTVNTASRAESSGEAGRINITEPTFLLVRKYFECTSRGLVEAKNKEPMEMHFLERLKPEYSQDPEGSFPVPGLARFVSRQ